MSKDLGLGKLITTPQERDAIHVAVAPVVAAQDLARSDHVGLDANGRASLSIEFESIGIVDPFLKCGVASGETFWLFLYPETVTGMRHHWQHPAFEAVDHAKEVAKSKAWLEAYAKITNNPYDEIMLAAKSVSAPAEEFIGYDLDYPIYDVPKEFWEHYQIATGTVVKEADRSESFTCRC